MFLNKFRGRNNKFDLELDKIQDMYLKEDIETLIIKSKNLIDKYGIKE
jgi:hypothetical protein